MYRNLRIREDTAKYLLNLNPDSAYYDPKTRSMREDPRPDSDAGDKFFLVRRWHTLAYIAAGAANPISSLLFLDALPDSDTGDKLLLVRRWHTLRCC